MVVTVPDTSPPNILRPWQKSTWCIFAAFIPNEIANWGRTVAACGARIE